MTKRLLALFLVCILAIPIFAVPASATTVIGDYGNLTGDIEYDNWLNIHNITNLLGILIDDVLTDIVNHVASMRSYISNIEDLLNSWVSSWADTMSTMFDSIELMIGWQEIQTEVQNTILSWNEDIWTALDTINTNFITFAGVMETAHQYILDSLNGFWDGFLLWWEDFNTFTTNWNSRITSLYRGLFDTQMGGYLVRIHGNITTLLNGSTSAKNEANEYENQVSTESTEFQENMDAIEEWTHPDYEADFDPSVDEITGGEDIGLYSDGLGMLIELSSIFPVLLFMAFSFSVISFVVFGKR